MMETQNPYEPPSEETSMPSLRKSNWRRNLLLIVLGILAIPSSLIAGFTTCYTVVMIGRRNISNAFMPNFELGLGLGLLTLVIVLGLFFYAMIRIYSSSRVSEIANRPPD